MQTRRTSKNTDVAVGHETGMSYSRTKGDHANHTTTYNSTAATTTRATASDVMNEVATKISTSTQDGAACYDTSNTIILPETHTKTITQKAQRPYCTTYCTHNSCSYHTIRSSFNNIVAHTNYKQNRQINNKTSQRERVSIESQRLVVAFIVGVETNSGPISHRSRASHYS